MSIFTYEDPDDGRTYLLNYIVTQHESEGPEYVEWKLADATTDTWHKLPPWAGVPQAAMDFWHGSLKSRCGVLLHLKQDSNEALVVDWAGLFITDLTLFSNVSNPDGDEVKPGDTIEVDWSEAMDSPQKLQDWLNK